MPRSRRSEGLEGIFARLERVICRLLKVVCVGEPRRCAVFTYVVLLLERMQRELWRVAAREASDHQLCAWQQEASARKDDIRLGTHTAGNHV